jgi:hypothetical protein
VAVLIGGEHDIEGLGRHDAPPWRVSRQLGGAIGSDRRREMTLGLGTTLGHWQERP